MRKYISFAFVFLMAVSAYSQGISSVQQRKLVQALSAISAMYVDTINDKKVIEASIRGVLEELDPHSTYIPKEEVQRMHDQCGADRIGYSGRKSGCTARR